jgi:hypothetical protein
MPREFTFRLGTSVNSKIDQDVQRQLESGDVNGEALAPEGQFAEGVTAERTDGRRVFLDQAYLRVLRLRNRGKD